jgi:hypothetical protein
MFGKVDTPEPNKDRITQMLREWSDGNRETLDGILPFIYDELRRQAANCFRGERKNHTLQTTALINEAYLGCVRYLNSGSAIVAIRSRKFRSGRC